jgi:hypothetical protein
VRRRGGASIRNLDSSPISYTNTCQYIVAQREGGRHRLSRASHRGGIEVSAAYRGSGKLSATAGQAAGRTGRALQAQAGTVRPTRYRSGGTTGIAGGSRISRIRFKISHNTIRPRVRTYKSRLIVYDFSNFKTYRAC